jgi:hypothetical protein
MDAIRKINIVEVTEYHLNTPAGSCNYLQASGQFQSGHYQTKALWAYCIGYACQLSYESPPGERAQRQ